MADDLNLKIDADFKDAIKQFKDLQVAAVESLKSIDVQLSKVTGFDALGKEIKAMATESQKGFAKLSEGADSLKEVEKNTTVASQAFSSFIGNLASTAVTKGFELIKDAAHELFQTFVVEGVASAIEAEDALNSLNQALAQNGNFTAETSKELADYAKQLQETTKFSDDAVIASLALLETMTGLSKDGLKDAETAAVNLASAYKIDLDTATRLVGKAAEGNVEAFKRYGIEIRKGSTDAESFANTLTVLNGKLGGRAAAEVNTYSGAIAVASNAFGEIQETIGNTIVKNVVFVDVIKKIGSIFNEVNGSTGSFSQTIREKLGEAIVVAAKSFAIMATVIEPLYKLVKGLGQTFVEVGVQIGSVASAAVQAAHGDFSGAIQSLKTNAIQSAVEINKAYTDSTFLGTAAVKFLEVGNVAEASLAKVKAGVLAGVEPLNQTPPKVDKISEAYKKLGEEGQKLVQTLAEKADPSIVLNHQLEAIQTASAQGLKLREDANLAIAQLEADFAAKNAAVLTEKNNKEITDLETRNAALAEIDATANAAEIEANQNQINYLIGQQGSYSTAVLVNDAKLAKQKKDLRKKADDEYVKDRDAFLSTASTLARSENQSLAAIGKAAAVTQIAIKTPPAVASSFEFGTKLGGPPLGFVFAGIAATAMAAQAAQIAGIPLATGSDFIRGPGTSTSDSIPARLSVGERVVPAKTNQDLTEFLSGNSQTNGLLSSILSRLQSLESTIVVNVGNREIVREVRQGLLEGRVLAV